MAPNRGSCSSTHDRLYYLRSRHDIVYMVYCIDYPEVILTRRKLKHSRVGLSRNRNFVQGPLWIHAQLQSFLFGILLMSGSCNTTNLIVVNLIACRLHHAEGRHISQTDKCIYCLFTNTFHHLGKYTSLEI